MGDREKTKKFRTSFFPMAALFAAMFFAAPGFAMAGAFFSDKFDRKTVLNEAGSMEESLSPDWWVNSGGQMKVRKGTGRTIQKKLSKNSEWSRLYRETNPEDTDGGKRPQNIFRLLTKTRWRNFTQQAYFKIKKTNKSTSENRNESNGILFFNRYEDGDNLYYTGLRVDGHAVIKKKLRGKYYTLAYNKIYGGKEYNRRSRPNLLPKKKSIGLKSEVRDIEGGGVRIRLYAANGRKGEWVLAAEATDKPGKYGGAVIASGGYAGIRTDFMDVEFDKYEAAEM